MVVHYNFTLFSVACRIWKYEMWTTTDECLMSMKHVEQTLHCNCSIRSQIVGGYVYDPSHQLNPFSDFSLFISNKDHHLIVVILVVIFILYFLLLLWTRKMDKEDNQELYITVLEDNDPRDSTAYLVGVFTGARLGATTTSNVGIRLFGDKGFSRSHILNSIHRLTLKSNSDNWFLLLSRHHVGTLTEILLWTDYSGLRPNWYCSKILVYDLVSNENDFFFVESWFGKSVTGIHLKTFKECATYRETNKISRIISENLLYGLTESHYYFSVFFKHPRSPVTRTQRLSSVLCGLLVNILVCTLLYYPSRPQSGELSSHNIIKGTIIIGMIGSLSACLVAFIFMHYFYSCYTEIESPTSFKTNVACCDIYHFKRRISVPRITEPTWLTNLKRIAMQRVKPIKALPLQSFQHSTLMGIRINKKKSKVLLALCIIIMVICSHLIIVISLEYGDVKMFLMCMSILFSVLQITLIVAPIKVFTLAILLGSTKTRFYETMTFSLGLNYITHTLKKKYNKNYKRFLNRLRNLDMYKAPTEFKIEKLREENDRFVLIVGIYYIISCLCFLCVIIWLIQLFKIRLYYLNMQTFCDELVSTESCQTIYRYDMENVMDFWDNLSNHILPVIYTTKWYNGQNKSLPQERFHRTGWMGNGVFRLIGVPRLRQIRANPEVKCHIPELMKPLVQVCHIPTTWLSDETEDHKDYGIGWSNNTWFRELFDTSPWKYTKPSYEKGSFLSGPSGNTYHDGGYIAYLHRDVVKTKASLANLYDTHWIDSNSRVIIIEFTMYNANRNVFTRTNIVVEVLTVESGKSQYYIRSVRITTFLGAGVLFLFIVAVFFIQLFCWMNIEGTLKFISNFWNFYDLLILILFLYCTLLYCTWAATVSASKEKLSEQGKDVYFSVHDMIHLSRFIRDIIGVLFSAMCFRLLRSIQFNEEVRLYTKDMLASRIEVFHACWITAMLIYVQFRFIMFLTVPPSAYSLKDVLVLRSQFKKIIRETYRESTTGKLLAYILNFTSQLGIFTFMLSQYHQFKKAQETRTLYLGKKQMKAQMLSGVI